MRLIRLDVAMAKKNEMVLLTDTQVFGDMIFMNVMVPMLITGHS